MCCRVETLVGGAFFSGRVNSGVEEAGVQEAC